MAQPTVRIGAAAVPAPGQKKKKKKNIPGRPQTVVVTQAAAEPEKKKRRRGGRGRKQPNGMMEKLGVKRKGTSVAAAYFGQKLLGGKTAAGIPQSILAGAALAYVDDGKSDWMGPASDGLVTLGAIEYSIIDYIRKGKIGEMLKPYIASVQAEGGDVKVKADALAAALGAATGDDIGLDDKMDRLGARMAAGG